MPSTTSVLEKTIDTGTVWRYYPFSFVDLGVANAATYTSYYFTDLALQDANATAIFNTLKTSNDCSSVGADDSAGFTVSEIGRAHV